MINLRKGWYYQVLVKKVYPGDYQPMESISRFLPDVEYITEEPKDGTPFWYELAFVGSNIDDFWEYDVQGNRMKDMLPYLQSGQAKLAICYMREFPFLHNDWVQMQSKIGIDACNKYNVKPWQIHYFYGNDPSHLIELHKRRINVIHIPYFEIDFIHRYINGEIDVCVPHEVVYKKPQRPFLDMNGKPHKYMRLRHVVHLWNRRLIDKGIINLYKTEEDMRLWSKDQYYELVKDIINEKDWEKFWKWWPHSHDAKENIDEKVMFGKHHPGYPYDKKLFMDTYMSLVSETHSGHCHPYVIGNGTCNDQFFLSEKLVKAIGNGHPFVVLATQNYLKQLTEYGYKTFSPYIDESYDKEPHPELRMVKAIDSIEKICKEGVPVSCLEIALHNQETLKNRYGGVIRELVKIVNEK